MSKRLQKIEAMLPSLTRLIPHLEAVYTDLHQHPELPMQEFRTANIVAQYLQKLGFEVHTGIGGTGVVGILGNGEGKTVMLRADMDALPMEEKTGLSYASTAVAPMDDGTTVSVAHMCGHDMHICWLMGVAQVLAEHREQWQGTLMTVFQPGEETGEGALAMVRDMEGAFPLPDIILGQHVMMGEAGTVFYRSGPIMAAADSFEVTLYGRGGHGSMPQNTIDPVIMAAYTAIRLQSIVSREIAPVDTAVLTIGSIHAGTKENIIPDHAVMKLNMRTYSEAVRESMLEAIARICTAESQASGSTVPPDITAINSYPLTYNDEESTQMLAQEFKVYFGQRAGETAPASGSEDFSHFGRSWHAPSVFWFVGGTNQALWEQAVREGTIVSLAANHSPHFVLDLEPTMKTGLEAMLVAALTWLG